MKLLHFANLYQLAHVSPSMNEMFYSPRKYVLTCNKLTLVFIACFLSVLASNGLAEDDGFIETRSVKKMAEILEDAEFAITERNFRINSRLHVGKAIREGGESNFSDFEVILFCNLSYVKLMLELAPDFIKYCPQRLAIYDTGKTRVITAPLIPENTSNEALNAVTREMNTLVKEIVEFSALDWPELDE